MSVTTRWLSRSSHVIYQQYADTFNFSIFRTALIEIRRLLMSTDRPIFVLIDYRRVEHVSVFSMLRGGVLIEKFRTPNATAGVAVAHEGSTMYRYNTLWLKVGLAVGSKAAQSFTLVPNIDQACLTITRLAREHDIDIGKNLHTSPEFGSTLTSENFNSSSSV